MTLKNEIKEPAYLFLPNHLITEEPWKSCVDETAYSWRGATRSEKGITLYLDLEDAQNLLSSLVLKYSKQVLTLKR